MDAHQRLGKCASNGRAALRVLTSCWAGDAVDPPQPIFPDDKSSTNINTTPLYACSILLFSPLSVLALEFGAPSRLSLIVVISLKPEGVF